MFVEEGCSQDDVVSVNIDHIEVRALAVITDLGYRFCPVVDARTTTFGSKLECHRHFQIDPVC